MRPDTLQSILVLIGDSIQGYPQTAALFLDESKLPFTTLFKLLKKEDEYVQLKSAHLCTLLMLEYSKKYDSPFDPSELFTWIKFYLAHTNTSIVDLAVQFLLNLLSVVEYRTIFYQSPAAMEA